MSRDNDLDWNPFQTSRDLARHSATGGHNLNHRLTIGVLGRRGTDDVTGEFGQKFFGELLLNRHGLLHLSPRVTLAWHLCVCGGRFGVKAFGTRGGKDSPAQLSIFLFVIREFSQRVLGTQNQCLHGALIARFQLPLEWCDQQVRRRLGELPVRLIQFGARDRRSIDHQYQLSGQIGFRLVLHLDLGGQRLVARNCQLVFVDQLDAVGDFPRALIVCCSCLLGIAPLVVFLGGRTRSRWL